MTSTQARVLGPKDGKLGFLGTVGVRFMISDAESGGGFALVEHPMSPKALAAPLHKHTNEDEYSFVIEGQCGALLGDEVLIGNPGDLIFKPRNQWHTFWNAGDTPCRILEIISPAGFEKYFEELSDMGGASPENMPRLVELAARYKLEVKPETIPELLQRFSLRMGEPLR
jgi:quercetin dioxygenase-like cupin family protein